MPPSPLAAGEKLHCVSYAPFRGAQTPLNSTTVIPTDQIEADLVKLAKLTDCIRIYSVDLSLDRVPELAQRHGLKVLLGVWISGDAKRNEVQIRTGIALAKRFPDTIRAVVVGNEVLLRGEMTAADLEKLVASVRAQVGVPVTYADVWEFWLRNRALAASVDFVTVHILPYWEDIPIAADQAASHIASIHDRVAAEFPGRDVLVGEAGWPSAGRMREGARPSPSDQARVLHDMLAAARVSKFQVNLIEAFDQPWKRHLEGTVGGHWGLYDDARRLKFVWGQPVSNHPWWLLQALAGVVYAAAVFAVGRQFAKRSASPASLGALFAIAGVASFGGAMAGAVVEATLIESLGAGGWLRSLVLLTVATTTPLAAAAAIGSKTPMITIAEVIGPASSRSGDGVALALTGCLIVTAVVAVEAALGLTFNPRYRDFPYTALSAAVVSFLIVSLRTSIAASAARPTAETTIAVLLGMCTIWIVWSEGRANWQALWLAAAFALLGITLARVRAVRG